MHLLFTLTLLLLSAAVCEAAPNCGVICNIKPGSDECKACILEKVGAKSKRYACCEEIKKTNPEGYAVCHNAVGRHGC